MLRWAITLTIFITANENPALQILTLLSFSVLWQTLILTSTPFDSRALNIIAFFNELTVSLYLYVAFLLSDFLETQINDDELLADSLRLNLAWILTSFLIFTIFVNLVFSLVKIAS
jgi:hypothetical protein